MKTNRINPIRVHDAPRLMLHQNLVVTVRMLCSGEWHIASAMRQMHLARSQVAVVVRSAHVQRFAGRRRAAAHRIIRHRRPMARLHPRMVATTQHLEIVLGVLSATVRHVRCVARHLGRDHFAVVVRSSDVQRRSVDVASRCDGPEGHRLAAARSLPAALDRRSDQHFVLRDALLGAAVRNVQAAVRSVHLARCQTALEVGASDVDGFAVGEAAGDQGVVGCVTVTGTDPGESVTGEHLLCVKRYFNVCSTDSKCDSMI